MNSNPSANPPTEDLPANGATPVSPEREGASPRRLPALGASEVEEIGLLEVASIVLEGWKLVLGLPLAAALAAAVISLVIPAKYTATSTFVPEAQSSGASLPGGMVGLAAQFGVTVPGGATNSPAFYAQVLRSRTLRDQVLLAGFRDPRSSNPSDTALGLDILRINGDSQRERLENGRMLLDGVMAIRVDRNTNIVSASAETPYPAFSADLVNLFIRLLNRFNFQARQSNAVKRRAFIEGRVTDAGAELRDAEEQLKGFLERNRQFDSSPELRFRYERLQRQVSIKEEVLTTLRRAYEEARIQEVNDTPVITVIDRAVPSKNKSSPRRKLNVAVAFFVGGVLGVFAAFGQHFMQRARQRDEAQFQRFSSRWAAMKAELRSALSRPRGVR